MKKSTRNYSTPETPLIATDPFRDFEGSSAELYIAKFFYILRSNLKITLLVIGAAVLIITGTAIWNVMESEKSEKAAAEFELLLSKNVINPETAEKEGAFRQLDAYLEKFSDRDSVNRVLLKKLEFHKAEKNYKDAAAVSSELSESVKPAYLKNYFRLMNAVYLEMSGNNEEALRSYESVLIKINEDSFMKGMALFGKGRTLIQTGKEADGKAAIRLVLEMKEADQGTEGLEDLKKAAAVFLITR